jgi:hypothetical protein
MSNPIEDFDSGKRKAFYPSEHESINAVRYPGTRQICELCGDATGRCNEDAMHDKYGGVVCEDCYDRDFRW